MAITHRRRPAHERHGAIRHRPTTATDAYRAWESRSAARAPSPPPFGDGPIFPSSSCNQPTPNDKTPRLARSTGGAQCVAPLRWPVEGRLRSVPAWIRCDADDRVRRARLERCARRRRAAQKPARALRRRPEVVVRQAPSGHHNPRRKVDIVIPKKKSRVPDRHSMRSYASNAAVRPHVRASNDSQHRDATPRAAEFILKCVSCQPPCAIRCRCPCPGNSGHCVRCPVVGRLLRT